MSSRGYVRAVITDRDIQCINNPPDSNLLPSAILPLWIASLLL